MTVVRPDRLHVDVHLVQSFPYSNLNRDRQSSPKTAIYGGVTRARLSSQNTKRHVRKATEAAIGVKAVRTREVPQDVAARLVKLGWEPETALVAGQMLILAASIDGLGIADTNGTNALLFLPTSALDELAALAHAHHKEITEAAAFMAAETAKAARKTTSKTTPTDADLEASALGEDEPAIGGGSAMAKHAEKAIPKAEVLAILRSRNASIATFGRMLANEAGSTVDGAVQVAHGLSTHTASTQLDFFTAVDDLQQDAGIARGAGHMGDNRFTSATFYRYASLNVTELRDNLDGDTQTAREVTGEFLRAFVTAVLPAKGSGTAAFTVPHLVYVAVRTDRPVSLVGAYETPIPATTAGYLTASLTALNAHAAAHHRFLGTDALAAHAHTGLADQPFEALGDHVKNLDELIARTLDALAKESM